MGSVYLLPQGKRRPPLLRVQPILRPAGHRRHPFFECTCSSLWASESLRECLPKLAVEVTARPEFSACMQHCGAAAARQPSSTQLQMQCLRASLRLQAACPTVRLRAMSCVPCTPQWSCAGALVTRSSLRAVPQWQPIRGARSGRRRKGDHNNEAAAEQDEQADDDTCQEAPAFTFDDFELRWEGTIEFLENKFASLQTGRAVSTTNSCGLLDELKPTDC